MDAAACRRRALFAGAVLILALAPGLRGGEPPCVWTGVERIVAVGDLHGDYEDFVRILRGTEVIDRKLAWIGGKTHLVQIGDIMDRGPDARKIFDLLRRLEKEAGAAGGMVHVLLGNHEELNITGIVFDYPDYVTVQQFVSFLPRIYRREKERELLKSIQGAYTHKPQEAVDAEVKRTLGEYWQKLMRTDGGRRAYIDGFNGTYGRWLLEKNAVIKINGTIFVHGGISEKYASMKLEAINGLLRKELAFYAGRDRAPVRTSRPFEPQIVYDEQGPLWYRDLATGEEGEIRRTFERILKSLGADSMVIAHTIFRGSGASPVVSARTMSRFDGRLWVIDTGISSVYGGVNSALIIENGRFSLWGESGESESPGEEAPPAEPAGAGRPDMEEFLRTAPVESVLRGVQQGRTEPWTVVLADGDFSCQAIFKYIDRRRPAVLPDSYKYELAAYEVCRELGLDLVPLVVERKIDGRPGSLQLLLEDTMTESVRRARGLEPPEAKAAGFRDKLEAVKIFALLVDDDCENLQDTLVDPRTWEVHRVDFSEAFSTSAGLREGCRPLAVPPGLVDKLRGLDEARTAKRLDRYLDKKEIQALFQRRDALLHLLQSR